MKHHEITGGAGTRIHLIEAGNPDGTPILFLHGFSQNALAWGRQLSSELGRDHRLIAMDLRGHGDSDRPLDGYGDSKLWADDVAGAIRELGLERLIMCGWSYGPLVILDYIRHYGEDGIAGIHFIAGVTSLGNEDALAVVAPEFLALFPGFCSSDVEESVRSLEALLELCFVHEVPAAELLQMLGWNVSVPPFVRQALFARTLSNDDVLVRLRTPVLLTHGAEDRIVRRGVVDQIRAKVPHAQVHIIDDAGHAPFYDAAAAFNTRLAAFADEVARVPRSGDAVLSSR
jgi:pimeloyl-ACP methyl ester carboxylesterase